MLAVAALLLGYCVIGIATAVPMHLYDTTIGVQGMGAIAVFWPFVLMTIVIVFVLISPFWVLGELSGQLVKRIHWRAK